MGCVEGGKINTDMKLIVSVLLWVKRMLIMMMIMIIVILIAAIMIMMISVIR